MIDRLLLFRSYVTHGGWVPGKNAGGCPNYRDTCATNPHYIIEPSTPTTVFISLLQKESKEKRDYVHVGLRVSNS